MNSLAAHTDNQLRQMATDAARAELVRRGLLPCPIEAAKRKPYPPKDYNYDYPRRGKA